MAQLFCDLDGVLADFDGYYKRLFGVDPRGGGVVDWDAMRAHGDFYTDMPELTGSRILWHYISPLNPIILTALPRSIPEAARYKRAWVQRHFGCSVGVCCCKSGRKYQYAEPGDILIDDRNVDRKRWIKAGGVWVAHATAEDTVIQLRDLGVIE